jgi:hypothetical protein
MDNKDEYTAICRERGLKLTEAAAELLYTPEHIHRVLTGQTPATQRFAQALLAWSGGRIDLKRAGDDYDRKDWEDGKNKKTNPAA